MTKRYIIEVCKEEDRLTCKRTNDGFDIYELLGVLEMAKNDILKQFDSDTTEQIDVVKRQVVEEGLKSKK